jgi:hypothetical protein
MFAGFRSRERPSRGIGAVLLCCVLGISGCGGAGGGRELPDVVLIVVDTLRADHL